MSKVKKHRDKDIWRNRIVEHGAAPADSFLAHDLNARRHPGAQREALVGSLSSVGWVAPVIVSARTGKTLDGHARIEEALTRDERQLVPFVKVDVSEAEERLILATFDPITDLAMYDKEALDSLLREVSTGDAALQSLLADLAKENGLYLDLPVQGGGGGDEFDATLDEGPTRSKPGDLWLIDGKHRVLCGDSTKAEDVTRLLGDARPALMITDPPYGVEYDANWRNEAAEAGLISHAARRVAKVANDDRADWTETWRLFAGDVVYCWHAGIRASEVQHSLEAAGFEIRSQIIWAKFRFAISRGHYHWRHEPCWYAVRKGSTAAWVGDRSQTTLWEIGLDKNVEGGHSTQKPLECMRRPIRHHLGDVYDPFLGSGTSLIAAHREGRNCYGLEIDPRFVDAILKRTEAEGLSVELAT
jgi:DNA modification methylase